MRGRLPLLIAWRFLRSARTQSLLIVAGIAVGIAVQVFVGSLITSLQSSLIETTIGSSPQITIEAPSEGDPIRYTSRVRELIAADDRILQRSVVPVVQTTALVTDGSASAPIVLTGGDLTKLDGIYRITERTTAGATSLGPNEIMLGTDLAERLGVAPGSSVALVYPSGRRATFTLSGVFDLGSSAANERQAFARVEAVQSALGWSRDQYSQVQAQLVRPFSADVVAKDWRTRLAGLKVTEWKTRNADLLTALNSQSASSYLIQVFVLVAVALGIASTLAIAAVQKTRQIGILKAMGLSDRLAGRVFLIQSVMLGGTGALGGIALAFLLLFGFSFSGAPFTITPRWEFVVGSALVGVTVSMLSSLVPSRRTARLDPIEVIQNA